MKKNPGKRYFSLMYVPDQEGEPKSLLLSYRQGRFLLAFLILLGIHTVLGAVGYVYIGHLRKARSHLADRVARLEVENKKIEKIAQELEEIRIRDEKIRKAFGVTLGLPPSPSEGETRRIVPSEPVIRRTTEEPKLVQEAIPARRPSQEGLYFLAKQEAGYFGPEHLPTLLPVAGYLTTQFQKEKGYQGRTHYGIDIAAPTGSVIVAAGAGTVILANWTPDFGNLVILSHGNGLYSYYGHAMQLLVDQGMTVRKGQPIALLGSSGISSASHLHFEIWKDGRPLDPEQYLFVARK